MSLPDELKALWDEFKEEMYDRLCECTDAGKTGWDDPAMKETLIEYVLKNVHEQDWVDVANLAMMLDGLEDKK